MKSLKITLFVAIIFASLTACTKQDLNEDDVLIAEDNTEMPAPDTGGGVDQTQMPATGGGVDQ